MPIVVDPIETHIDRWTISHIGEKVFEYLPTLAYFDASRAIVLIAPSFGIAAPPKHRLPSNKLRTTGFALSCVTMADVTVLSATA